MDRGRLSLAGAAALALLSSACADLQPAALDRAPLSPAGAVEVGRARNPVFAAADPHLTVADGRYWIYATTPREAGDPRWARLYAYSSPELRTWMRSGPVFSFEGVDWIDDDGAPRHHLWAPALLASAGRYYLFYSVGPQNPTPSRLGVAVGTSPAGPFRDSGAPLLTGGNGFEAIDPMVFVDPKTRVAYLYAGGSAGSTLRVFELAPSFTAIKREVSVPQPRHFTEGPFMHERNGVYYLSYSQGRWDRSDYSSHYSTAPTPLGPWTYRGVLLSSDARRKGPGHHSIAQNPGTGEWFIAYHRWEATGDGPFEGDRQVAVQRLFHNEDGTLQPIRMDDEPPPASPLSQPRRAGSERPRSLGSADGGRHGSAGRIRTYDQPINSRLLYH